MIGSFLIENRYNLVKVVKGKHMVCSATEAVDDMYIRKENIGEDGHLSNRNRARPYLAHPYESYFCQLGSQCPSLLGEDCPTNQCKPFDSYWDGFDLGFLTGSINNVIVVDNDSGMQEQEFRSYIESAFGKLPTTWTAISGGGGQHFYYYYNGIFESSISSLIPKVDILGENRWVRLPPCSTHKGSYKWRIPPSRNLAPAPRWLEELNILKHRKPLYTMPKVYGAVNEDDLSAALFHIPIDSVDHETWSKLGYALCSSGREQLFVSWCQTDPDTRRHVTGKQLSLFRNSTPLENPEGVVFKAALNHGWRRSP